MRRLLVHIRTDSKGFTLMELLIAMAVFATVLLVATAGILQFTRVYYKGVTENNTQDVARTVVDLIAQGIQFNGGAVTTTVAGPTAGNSYAFCVGNQQYSYTTNYELNDNPNAAAHQSYHVMVVNNVAGCTASTPAQNVRLSAVSGRELFSPNMRLARMQVTNVSPNVYQVSVRVVYGDDDILTNPLLDTASCKSIRLGSQFCAVSDITTVVTKRVQ
ncbi:MAG TPA: prepilin-type N-terminal cleavage/methylation domain-containing protein [Candidatus Saccharimonadales bacterium]